MEACLTPKKYTPKKVTKFLSPSVSNIICILCGTDIPVKYKSARDNTVNLWKNGKKTTAALNVERYLFGVKLDNDTDFKVICKTCNKKTQCALEKLDEVTASFNFGRRERSKQFIRSRQKRCLPTDISKSTKETGKENVFNPRKKRLNFTSQQPDNGNKVYPDIPNTFINFSDADNPKQEERVVVRL